MDTEATCFNVLLAEDDPVSQAFLEEALRTGGATPTTCTDGQAALALARTGNWNLLIFDQHLPGMDGDAVLAALRADHLARGLPPALATTAEPDTARAGLLQAGFVEVLPKPSSVATVHAALRRHGCDTGPLDDDDALRACGSASAMKHLRRLFVEQELPRILGELDAHGNDHHALRPTLHRLRASCGFCGATTLARATEALHNALAAGAETHHIELLLQEFARALRETRAALHVRLGGG